MQCPEIIEKINEFISANSDSHLTNINDALTQSVGKDSRGQMRGLGSIGMSHFRKMNPLIKKHQKLQCDQCELLMHFEEEISDIRATMEALKKNSGDTRFRFDTTPSPTPRSSHASSTDRLCIGQYCKIYRRFPMVPVANGEVRSLDPTEIVHGTPMGEGRCKLVLTEVINGGARLYKPDGFCETIEQVGVGGFVVWGKEYLRF